MNKYLIIRFSSLGDIFHAFEVPHAIKQADPRAEVHWAVRDDLAEIVKTHPDLTKVWVIHRKDGFKGLLQLAKEAGREEWTHVYDAHSNVRSHIFVWLLRLRRRFHFIRRSKERLKRHLLFFWRKNLFPKPYRSAHSFLEPLKQWNVRSRFDQPGQMNLDMVAATSIGGQTIVLAPSAAWEMKRWPTEYWQRLIKLLPDRQFAILGGPDDDICAEIADVAPERTYNLAGHLSWIQTAKLLSQASLVIAGDTGAMHIADYLGRRTLALIGPTAFGFPSRSTSTYFSQDLWCQPCSKDGRGRCKNKTYKACLFEIPPERVAQWVKEQPAQ